MLLPLLGACGGGGAAIVQLLLGDPNPAISPARRAAFFRGRAVFQKRFTQSEGHGPDFNTSSCRSCHEIPVTGGSSPLYRNFYMVGRIVGGGVEPALGDDDQFVARSFSYERLKRENIPTGPDIVVAQRNAPPMFGLGLLERVPDGDILRNQDPADLDGDGVRGFVNFDSIELGRFGYKAQSARLIDFIRGPFFNHMGITSNPLPSPGPPQVPAPDDPTTDEDGVPDPELAEEDLADILVFVQELAPPQPLPMDPTARRGEALFESIGCAKCHIPNLVTNGEPVFAYTDLLLHDMGLDLADGIVQGAAMGQHFRTAALWGLRHHAPYLHDGRADTIDEAIRAHGGPEADAVRIAYESLNSADRDAVLAFLETR